MVSAFMFFFVYGDGGGEDGVSVYAAAIGWGRVERLEGMDGVEGACRGGITGRRCEGRR